ncbi:hypothetical protein AcW1_003555 [Taiwanofungus camphoratus]|nr:hypothetical protein AcV5_001982 [Antrodia cinnamomea]KAI0941753.1 hypothetical protein AcW1_003555 [Antrodia cinnamomea]
MGVLGGISLVALFVLIVVPLARRRKRRKSRLSSRDDVESRFLSSRRSSSRHQKHQKIPAGPDTLLPFIDPLSTFTLSGLRSKTWIADSMDEVATYSFCTDNATTSHSDPGEQSPGTDEMGQDNVDAAGVSHSCPNRPPTPPGLPSKPDASTASARLSHSSIPPSTAGAGHRAGGSMFPLSPVSPVFSNPSGSTGRARAATHRPGMESVAEDSAVRHLVSRQLPSPPSSPEVQPSLRATMSRRRPDVASGHSSSTTLPFRPHSTTGPSTSVPLAPAFQSSLQHSAMQLPYASSVPQEYPSITGLSPLHQASRSRSSTMSVDISPRSETEAQRPIDASRRMSTTDIRYRHPSADENRATMQGRAHPHPPESLRIPQYQEAGSSVSHRQAMHGHTPSFTTMASIPRSPPLYPATCLSPRPRTSLDSPRPGPSNVIWKQQPQPQQQQQQQQPALVKRKDSLALRPLPTSPFVHSFSNRPPGPSSSRSRSGSVMSERSLPSHLPPLDPLPPLNFDEKSPRKDGDRRPVS